MSKYGPKKPPYLDTFRGVYLKGKEGYMFKFDLKNVYHHLDISDPHQRFLGFPWVIKR